MISAYDGPLQLVDADRFEQFEIRSPLTGYVIEVVRNLETGECSYSNTDRTELTVPAEDGATS